MGTERRRACASPAALATALALLVVLPAQGRGIPYGEVIDSAVQHCDALNWSVRHAEAQSCYRLLADGGMSAAARAEGAWALGDLKRANDAFRAAVAADPASALLRARWGELYIDSHQPQQALELFQEALQRNPKDAYAQVDEATVLADEYEQKADRALAPLLTDEPAPAGARLRALLLAARMALEDTEPQRAQTLLDRAQLLAGSAHLPSLDIDALRAALAQFQEQDGSAWIRRAIAQDPGFGEAYATPAHFYDIRWREGEAIALYQQAVQADPRLWSAQVQLASCLLREDRVAEATRWLHSAYQGDPYDPVTVNTLRLLDELQQFDVRDDGHRPDGKPVLQLRISRQESAPLAPYVQRLAEQAIQTYSARYHFQLGAPVVVEIYPNHDDLAVRTAGLPGLGGELGVTFGYLVALDSPSARESGAFSWGITLWHEMAHVFTLESTDFHVPRWLTEGLSKYEEWRSGPIRGVEIPDYVLVALAQGKALPIAQLNRGFVHPTYPQQLLVSYMQAALTCEFIERRFGTDKLLALLHAFVTTSDVSTALERALGLSASEFDQRFHADLLQHYGRLFTHIDAWRAARSAAERAAAGQDWGAAEKAAEQALALEPQDVEDDSPYLPLAQAYAARGQDARAVATLLDYWRRGGHDPEALRELAARLHAAGQLDEAIAVLDRVNYVAPLDDELHATLGDWLLQARRARQALGEYQVAMALHPPDEAAAHLRLARAQFALGDLSAARREVLSALEIAPDYRPAQSLLLQIVQVAPAAPDAPAPSSSAHDARKAPP